MLLAFPILRPCFEDSILIKALVIIQNTHTFKIFILGILTIITSISILLAYIISLLCFSDKAQEKERNRLKSKIHNLEIEIKKLSEENAKATAQFVDADREISILKDKLGNLKKELEAELAEKKQYLAEQEAILKQERTRLLFRKKQIDEDKDKLELKKQEYLIELKNLRRKIRERNTKSVERKKILKGLFRVLVIENHHRHAKKILKDARKAGLF
jgi:chromosome segregation ATPase